MCACVVYIPTKMLADISGQSLLKLYKWNPLHCFFLFINVIFLVCVNEIGVNAWSFTVCLSLSLFLVLLTLLLWSHCLHPNSRYVHFNEMFLWFHCKCARIVHFNCAFQRISKMLLVFRRDRQFTSNIFCVVPFIWSENHYATMRTRIK